jgi:hypothetical protein
MTMCASDTGVERPSKHHLREASNAYCFVGANPINRLDPLGLNAVPERLDRGVFYVQMGATNTDNISSGVEIRFIPNAQAKSSCTEIRFIQLAASEEGNGKLNAIPPDSDWHIDDGTHNGGKSQFFNDEKPYYKIQTPWNPNIKPVSEPTNIWGSLSDEPGGVKGQQAWETVAVAVSGPEKGTVYGAIYWGHFMTKDVAYQQRWANNAGPIWWTYTTPPGGSGPVWQQVGALGAVRGVDYEIRQNAGFVLPQIKPGHASQNFWRLVGAAGLLPKTGII